MDGFQVICTILVVAFADLCTADREYMVSKPESIAVSINFETKLECVMNIQPDNFQWKFYPLGKKDAYNPKARISLTTSPFQFVPSSKYENNLQKKMSSLVLQADSEEIAGDYQCLAHYGASVVASVPWRVTIAKLGDFPKQQTLDVTVVEENTVNWRCEIPRIANPEPYVDYTKSGKYFKTVVPHPTKSLILPWVGVSDSGSYKCTVGTIEGFIQPETGLNLKVVKKGQGNPQNPKFVIPPKSVYNVSRGETAFLECTAIGNPVPEVTWKKYGGLPVRRISKSHGGLAIKNVTLTDSGAYECIHKNEHGTISHSITLNVVEPPSILCLFDSTDAKQGDSLDLDCTIEGTPKPEVSWFLNGFAVTNDSKISTSSNTSEVIHFRPAEKRHAGNLQLFARNVVGTVYRSIFLTVIPLSTTQENVSDIPVVPTGSTAHRKNNNSRKVNKHSKIFPPSKPMISRISDEAVLLRWTVQPKGLPVQFFKVQYKELGPANQHDQHSRAKGSKWMTTNLDIPPHIRSYEVMNLKPDHFYKFRIAAVYSNNDNKNSPNSDKFHLRKLDFEKRNPLPVPLITYSEPINSTAVRIFWELQNASNIVVDSNDSISVDGFFVNYNSASSAADYMKTTVDGSNTTSYILTHLQPDTVYDIKLQSFNSKYASPFSQIHKVKTHGIISTTLPPTVSPSANIEAAGVSKLYIIIAAAVLGGCGVIVVAVGLIFYCRKSKQKKNSNRGVDDHHIQVDGNEYVVGPKSGTRSNGCVPSNRITITANPLAEADNKNQNMIEMSCLSSQNNNCSNVQASGSGEDSPTNSRDNKNKAREKRIRNKHDSNTSGENYV